MFKHIAVFAAAMFISLTAFAGKPYSVLVFDDLSRPASSDQQDNRTASLLIEYLKSELATHSQITLCDAEAVEKAMKEFRIKHKLGTTLTEDEIKDVLSAAKGDYMALLAIIPDGDAKNVRVTVYDKNGKQYDPLTVPITSIRESDLPAVVLAIGIARLIRGESPVDRLSLEREKQLMDESAEDRAQIFRSRSRSSGGRCHRYGGWYHRPAVRRACLLHRIPEAAREVSGESGHK